MKPLAWFAALFGGTIGAAAWAAISRLTGLEIGYAAWGIGLLVGYAAKYFGGKGIVGDNFQDWFGRIGDKSWRTCFEFKYCAAHWGDDILVFEILGSLTDLASCFGNLAFVIND